MFLYNIFPFFDIFAFECIYECQAQFEPSGVVQNSHVRNIEVDVLFGEIRVVQIVNDVFGALLDVPR